MKQHYPCQTWARRAFLFLLFLTMKTQAATSTTLDDTSSITLHVVNQPIENIFKLIEKQTGLTFYYGRAILDGSQRASVSVDKASLSEVMGVLLKGKNVSWTVKDKGVVLSKSSVVPEKVTTNVAGDTVPKIDVSGVVVDVKGNPIAGASVALKGQARGQGTDAGGRFSFSAVPANASLIISSLGFDTKQIKIRSRTDLTISLDSVIREIQAVEVVSDGYSLLPRERVNGSFVQLDNALINRTVSTGILDRIMDVTSSLRPGKSGEFTIRGYSTINASNAPLIVIDGFPYLEPLKAGALVLDNLNPNDVESITILRDAAAASIWGARSGNGVIVITTKKGNFNRKMSIQVNASTNFIEKPRLGDLKLISSPDLIEFEKMRFDNGAYNRYDDSYPGMQYFPSLSPAVEIMLAQRRGAISADEANTRLAALSKHDVRDDINKYLLQTAINQQYNVNVSGGSDKISYYGSIGYDKNDEALIGNNSDRFTLRIDNAFKPIRQFELRTFIAYTQSKNINNSVGYNTLIANGNNLAAPYTFLADESGNPLHLPGRFSYRSAFVDTITDLSLLDWHYRPIEERKFTDKTSKQYTTRIGGSLKYSIITGLDLEFRGQYENGNNNSSQFYDARSYTTRDLINTFMYADPSGRPIYPVPLGGILDFATTAITNWNTRTQLNYNKGWTNHTVSALAAYETSESKYNSSRNRKFGYNPNNGLYSQSMDFNTVFGLRPSGNRGSGSISPNTMDAGTLVRTISYLGNALYMYKDRYSITISGRIDASNFLGAKANQRSVPLWSTGLGWEISRENFYTAEVLPFLKLRASYGYNGNLNNKATALPTASYTPAIIDINAYHSEPYLTLVTAPNPGLTWEKIRIVNLGVDFQAKGRRLNGSVEFYTKRGINLIGPITVEATKGVTNYVSNYASFKGRGFDIMLQTFPIKTHLIWENNINISYNTDKITDYKNDILPTAELYASSEGWPIIGKPIQKLFSYPSAGLNPQTGAPQGYLKGEATDFNNFMQNAKIEDLIYHGSAVPQIFGNMRNTFSYAGVSLSFNITYQFKYYFRRASINYNSLFTNWGGHSDYALRWKKEGDEAFTNVPALPVSADSRSIFYALSSDLIERGDHIRLQDIRLGYSMKTLKIWQLDIPNFSIYAYARNLGIIWKANKSGTDPNFADNSVPPSRSLAISLSIGF